MVKSKTKTNSGSSKQRARARNGGVPRKNKQGGSELYATRTLQSVESSLAKNFKRGRAAQNDLVSKYAACRHNPFGIPHGVGIPDGAVSRRIVVDHRSFGNITVGTDGGFVLRLIPVPNMPLLVKPYADPVNASSGFLVNGGTTNVLPAGYTYGNDYAWTPAVAPKEWVTWNMTNPLDTASTAAPPEVANPYLAVKFRIVSCALRLVYGGTVVNAAGFSVVNTNRATCIYGGACNQFTSTELNWFAGAITAPTHVARQFYVMRYDSSSVTTALDPESNTYRSEVPLHVNLRPLDMAHNFYPVYPCKPLPVDSASFVHSVSNLNSWADANFVTCGFVGYDADWQESYVTVSGATPNTTYRVEVAMCVEYEPAAGTVMSAMAKEASFVPDLAVVDRKVNTAVPVAQPAIQETTMQGRTGD